MAPGGDRLARRRHTAATCLAGRLIQPDYRFSLPGPDPYPVKAALGLAFMQVVLALRIYGKLPAGPQRLAAPAHRINGAVIFLLTVPVAVHCLIAHGVQPGDLRVAIHRGAGRSRRRVTASAASASQAETQGDSSPVRAGPSIRQLPSWHWACPPAMCQLKRLARSSTPGNW